MRRDGAAVTAVWIWINMENGLKSTKPAGPYSVGQSLPVFSHATFIPACFYFFSPPTRRLDARCAIYTPLCTLVSAFCATRVERAYANTVFFFPRREGGRQGSEENCLIEPFAACVAVKIHACIYFFLCSFFNGTVLQTIVTRKWLVTNSNLF